MLVPYFAKILNRGGSCSQGASRLLVEILAHRVLPWRVRTYPGNSDAKDVAAPLSIPLTRTMVALSCCSKLSLTVRKHCLTGSANAFDNKSALNKQKIIWKQFRRISTVSVFRRISVLRLCSCLWEKNAQNYTSAEMRFSPVGSYHWGEFIEPTHTLFSRMCLNKSHYSKSWSWDEMLTWKHPHSFLSWIAQSHFWASKVRLCYSAQKWVRMFPSQHLIPEPWNSNQERHAINRVFAIILCKEITSNVSTLVIQTTL